MSDSEEAEAEPKNQLKDWQEKILLEDIEKNDAPISDYQLIKIANREKRTYGFPGTNLRELFRYRFKYLKSLPIEVYVRWLRRYGVTPSRTTQALLLDFTTASFEQVTIESPPPLPPPPPQAPSTPPPAPSTPPPASVQEEDTVYSSSSGNDFSPMRSPPPFRSPMRSPAGLMSPSIPSPFTHQIISTYLDEWNEPSQGTMDDPIRINVDMSCPANNGIFDIAWIPQKIIHGYARNVVCV
jgi:hypothetical protein